MALPHVPLDVERLACAAQLCYATPKLRELLQKLAGQIMGKQGQAGQAGSELTKVTLCFQLCAKGAKMEFGLTEEDYEPSAGWLHRAKDAAAALAKRSGQCIDEWPTLVEVPAEPLRTLARRAFRALDLCGLVRIHGLFAGDAPWLQALEQRLLALREEPEVFAARARIERRGRPTEDALLPALPKLLLSEVGDFLTSPPVLSAVQQYFRAAVDDGPGALLGGSEADDGLRLSYASWIVAPPVGPEAGTAARQKVHADLAMPRSMVSAHLALHRIKKELGPTGFCPGTHAAGDGDASLARLLRVSMMTSAKENVEVPPCPSFVAPETAAGTLTIYDSAVFHYGTANTGSTARVLLNANMAARASAIREENYQGYFHPNGTARSELQWQRQVFDQRFVQRILERCPDEDAERCASWAAGPRAELLRTRIGGFPSPALAHQSMASTGLLLGLVGIVAVIGLSARHTARGAPQPEARGRASKKRR